MKLPDDKRFQEIPSPWLLPDFEASKCKKKCGRKCVWQGNSCLTCCCPDKKDYCDSCGEKDLNE